MALTTGEMSGIEAALTTYAVSALPGSRKSWTPPDFPQHYKVRMRGKQIERAGQFVWEEDILGVAHPDSKMAAWYTKRLKLHLGQNSLVLSQPGKWNRLMGDLHMPKLTGKPFSAADLLKGGAAGFIFDMGWSYYQDMGNPYLTTEHKLIRAGMSGDAASNFIFENITGRVPGRHLRQIGRAHV